MSNDHQIISYLSPAELAALINATGIVSVHEIGQSDGKPVIHAAVKVVNSQTGEQLPGGLPFSVVMFKGAGEPAYSNIAIGTIVPAAELKVSLPRDYFNFCNQRFRFTRTFPLDERSFVIQMDLVLKNATREYVKFSFGLWGALFSHMLFELMGRGRESLVAAAEAYAAARTDFAEQMASSPEIGETAQEAVMALASEAIVVAEPALEAPANEDAKPEAPAAETAEPQAPAADEESFGPCEHIEITADPVEGKDEVPELTIAAGPAAEAVAEEVAAEPAKAEAAIEPAKVEPAPEAAEVKTDAAAERAQGAAEATHDLRA